MHCRFDLARPPRIQIEARTADDQVLPFIEVTWMAQQIPLALLLWTLGGWGWVLWGVSVRIVLSLTGHWAVDHFAHRTGHQGWHVDGLPVQGYNLPGLGWITFGENWHGNHHAFPHSARLGVEFGQTDPGYIFIRALAALRLARNIRLPDSKPPRDGVRRVRTPLQPQANG